MTDDDGQELKYPFSRMKIGQGMFFQAGDAAIMHTAASAYKISHPGWDYTSKVFVGGIFLKRTS